MIAKTSQGRVHVIARDVRRGDAIGNFVLRLHSLLLSNHIESVIFSENFEPLDDVKIINVKSLHENIGPDDIIFYHFSIYDPYLKDICHLDNKKICYYHGITPPELLESFDLRTSNLCQKGLDQISQLNKFDLFLCNSKFSSRQLVENKLTIKGTKEIKICPPLIEYKTNTAKYDVSIKKHDGLNINNTIKLLYVGRIAPHKKIEDLIRYFVKFKIIEKNSVLNIVGRGDNADYNEFLKKEIKNIPVETANRIIFLGYLSDNELIKVYQSSDFFVTMSEHEGFCVPLFEAMKYELPIMACNYGAIGETLSGAGIFCDKKDFDMTSKKMQSVLIDQKSRSDIVQKQKKRYRDISIAANGKLIIDAVIKLFKQ